MSDKIMWAKAGLALMIILMTYAAFVLNNTAYTFYFAALGFFLGLYIHDIHEVEGIEKHAIKKSLESGKKIRRKVR
jgi:hypothetical protein